MNTKKNLFGSSFLLLACVGVNYAQVESQSGVGSSLYSRAPVASANLALSEEIQQRQGFHVGALQLHPRIEATAIKEDNVFLSSQTDTKETYVVVSPGLLARIGSGKSYAYVDATTDIPFSYDEDSENVDNFQVTTVGRYEKSKSTLNGRYTYRDLRSGDIILANRVSSQSHIFQGGYDHATSQKTALGGSVTYNTREYDFEDYIDSKEIRYNGRIYWKAFDKTSLFLQLSYGDVDVDGRNSSFGDAEYYEGGLGLVTDLNSRWSASGLVGYQTREFKTDGIDTIESLTSAFNISSRLFDHLHAELGFWSMVQPAANEAGATLVETRIEPSLSRRIFMDSLVASGSVVWGWVDYETPDTQAAAGEIDSPQVFDGREDEYWGYTVGLDWQALQKLALSLNFSHIENDSNNKSTTSPTDYEAERWVLRAQYNF